MMVVIFAGIGLLGWAAIERPDVWSTWIVTAVPVLVLAQVIGWLWDRWQCWRLHLRLAKVQAALAFEDASLAQRRQARQKERGNPFLEQATAVCDRLDQAIKRAGDAVKASALQPPPASGWSAVTATVDGICTSIPQIAANFTRNLNDSRIGEEPRSSSHEALLSEQTQIGADLEARQSDMTIFLFSALVFVILGGILSTYLNR